VDIAWTANQKGIKKRMGNTPRSPCLTCRLRYHDKDTLICRECELRISYLQLLIGPQEQIPEYDIPKVRPQVDNIIFKTRTNLNPLRECIYPYCSTQTRHESGYCHRCTMRNYGRIKKGIPLDAPLLKGIYRYTQEPELDRN